MKKNLVSYETALLLKQKGFNEPTKFFYWSHGTSQHLLSTNLKNENFGEVNCSAPTIDEVRQWLADKHKIYIEMVCQLLRKNTNTIQDIQYRWGAICMNQNIYKVADNYASWDESLREAVETIVKDII